MYKRTFEVLAKFISEKNNVSIVFDTEGGAHADMKTNTLHLPKEIANKHAYTAISLMMHESGHIKHSQIIPIKEICKTKGDFHILNAIEDVRVDRKNFSVLPNIIEFYRELTDEVTREVDKKTPLAIRALCWGILQLEGFSPSRKFGDDARKLGTQLSGPMIDGVRYIEQRDWTKVKEVIDEIKKLLGIPPSQDPPVQEQMVMGAGTDGPLSGVEDIMRPGKCWAKGQGSGMVGGSSTGIGELAMDEMCANQFKEIMNIKERKVTSDGSTLDTDNLLSYHTGDVESLFKEEKIVKKKKSKIMFLLDASGSMCSDLVDGQMCGTVVTKSVKKMTRIIDEVAELEGVNIEWEVGAFQDNYIPLTKGNWENEYRLGGGTSFAPSFIQVMEEMVKDYSVDGKKIIIVMTDGCVSDYEIREVKEAIIRNYSDVRSLIISVGSDANSAIVKEITGDNIIVAENNATHVIMETIKSLL